MSGWTLKVFIAEKSKCAIFQRLYKCVGCAQNTVNLCSYLLKYSRISNHIVNGQGREIFIRNGLETWTYMI